MGDHMPYNTVLIYPNYDIENPVLREMTEQQRQEYFSSVIVTVNKFLAPYESIVDFRIIDRPFTQKKGELTPKKTYKRRVIEKNFEELINSMYEKSYSTIYISDLEVRIPNWFFREKGCLSRDIVPVKDGISIPKLQTSLKVIKCGENNTHQIGEFCYKFEKKCVELQRFLINPMYWVGNEALFNFTGNAILQWYRHQNRDVRIKFLSKEKEKIVPNELREKMKVIMSANEYSLYGLHLASILLQSVNSDDAWIGIQYLREVLNDKSLSIYYLAVEILFRPKLTEDFVAVRREMFKVAVEKLPYEHFYELLKSYLYFNPDLLDENIQSTIAEHSKGEQRITSIENVLKEEVGRNEEDKNLNTQIVSLLELLAVYGIKHPTTYETIRQILVRYELKNDFPALAEKARNAKLKLRDGFRSWLGANQNVAVDVETGEEYGWTDVITMEGGIDKNDADKILSSITEKPILREAIFLFSKGTLVRLNNILPGGIWISHYTELEHKTVYRISVQTRMQGSFDIMFHLNRDLPWDKLIEKTNWLILAGSRFFIQELVEDFGGFWDEYDLWTQKYIPGETVGKYISRETRKLDESRKERLRNLWTFFVWNASAAYINFWKLTLYQLELVDPTPSNVIIPPHDYQTGTRFVSLSDRMEHEDLFGLITNFYYKFIEPVEDKYEFLKKKSIWNYLFSGLINAEGEKRGFEVLENFKKELKNKREFEKKSLVEERLDVFLKSVKEKGFIPKQLFFAIKRFHRWFNLNKDATLEAQAEMLSELHDTYNLLELEKIQRGTRIRFFLETVFNNSKESFRKVLYDLIGRLKAEKYSNEQIIDELTRIQSEFDLTKKESFFLTRLSYPHIKPTDSAAIMSVRGEGVSAANLVVEMEDYDGNPYFIRSPISPKEISRLHQLFIDASLLVHFRPEHRFLVALSDRGYIIGGLFYTVSDDQTAHMEKIVVSNKYRRKGISEGLMNEFFNRMRDANSKYVTTGFFRPEYFYRFGFKIERKYSGLVKEL